MKLTFEIQFISVISLFSLISAGNLSYRIKGSRSTTVRHQQQQITETLPITNNHRRRLQADPKKGDPELDKKGEEPLPKDAKGIDPKKAKEKAGPMFDEMVSSNDCILNARSPSEIEIGCMQSASSSEVTGDDSPKKKKTSKGSKDSNQIDYKIQTGRSGLTVSVQYTDAQAQTGDDGGLLPKLPKGGSGTTQYEIVFDKIIEYVKDDPDSINKEYDFENDKVVRTVDLDKWNDISEDESNGSSDNKIYYSASSSDGVAEFNFFVEVT